MAFVFNTGFLCILDNESKVEACLPLLVSMMKFEATHGNHQKSIKEMNLLIEKYPTVAELWLMLIE